MTHRAFLLISLSLLLARAAGATCYRDSDGDGYAGTSASTTPATANGCPAGYVTRRGDCDTGNAAVHPRGREVYGDNKDNNCDGSVDEPQFNYSLVRAGDSSYPLMHMMSVTINDLTSAFWLTYSFNQVGYRMEITDLDGSPVDGAASTAILPPASSPPASAYRLYDASTKTFAFFTVGVATRLLPHHVYKVRVRLHKISDGTAIGPWSNVYYTVSSGDASDPTSDAEGLRADMVLLAFHEVGESAYGSVGYRGTVDADGLRYAHKPDGTVGSTVDWHNGWCDMFWGWVAYNAVGSDFLLALGLNNQRKGFADPHYTVNGDPWADGIHHQDASYYDDGMGSGGTFYYDAVKSNVANGDLGDFLLAEGHAGMYLTTHIDSGNIITVEGNNSDEVKVIEGGRANVWPPPATRNFWVGIGKLNDYELGL